MPTNIGITYALLAALLFGASTPFAKLLVGQTAPLVLAGLLYLAAVSAWAHGWYCVCARLSGQPAARHWPPMTCRGWPARYWQEVSWLRYC